LRGAWNMRSDAISRLRDLGSTYLRRRYTILFYMLLLTLLTAPIFSALKLSGTLLEALLAFSLIAAIMPVHAVRSRRALLAVMMIVWLARPVTEWLEHRVLSAMTLGIWTLIGLLAAAGALRFAMGATQVDSEHLYAALSAYLLAGIYFGLLYWVLEQMNAGTFALTGELTQSSAIYFSFVTLATLGYGDIAPRAEVARALAIVEGIGGQLFLAVLVARLVSLYSKPGNQSS
jgi:voltage-gated potassium channel